MSSTFRWEVITPEAMTASGECEFLVVPAAGGQMGVLPGHAALVALVVPGELRVTTGGVVHAVPVGAGLVEVRDNTVRLLVMSASAGGSPPAPPSP